MLTLMQWYPGDRACDFFLIVAIGVTLLSAAAWVVAWRLPRRPATRHLVLASAMICCLAMPALASVFAASGWALIAIPLLPAGRASDSTPMPSVDARATRATPQLDAQAALPWASPFGLEPGHPRALLGPSPSGLDPSHTGPGVSPPGVAVVAAGSAGKPPEVLDRGRADIGAEWPSAVRGGATMVLMAWGCGSVLLLLNLARSYGLIRRLRRASSPPRDDSLQALLDDVGRRMGVRRLPRVVVSRRAMTPMAIGLRRPIVVLPERFLEAVDVEEMRDVLVHEVAHIRRGDPLVVLLQELARALYWPIVTVHGLIRELGQAREELCDNHVLRDRDALSYGETLLHLAELSWEGRPLRVSVGILHWKGALERRIAGLLDQRRSTMTGNSRWLVGLVAMVFVCGGTIAAATRFVAAKAPKAAAQESAARKPDSDDTSKKTAAGAKPPPASGRSILVHVVGPDGRPMAGVNVHRSVWTRKPGARGNVDLATDERGEARFELPESMYIFRIWARAKGYVPLFAHWEEQDNPEKSLPKEFTFRLEPGTVIGGMIRDPDGRGIPGARVEVMLTSVGPSGGRTGPDMWLAEGDAATTTDAEGRWMLDNVPAGKALDLRLKIGHADYISDPEWGKFQEQQGVDLAALRARKATITMRGGLSATGTVIDPDGKPVVGAVVVRGERPYWDVGSQEVLTDAQGVYRLPPLPRGPLTITVVAQGWMPWQKKVDLQPGMKPVDFPLLPGKEVRIRVVDRLGKPISAVHVGIAKWRGNEALYNHRHPNVLNTEIPVQSDESGLYQWTWAPDDAVSYTFWKEGYAERKAELIADGKEQTITLQATLQIAGKVTDAATGRPIENLTAIPVLEFSPGRFLVERQHKKTSSDGSYTLELDRTDVAYRVRVEAEGYRSAMSDAVRVGAFRPTFDFRLEPAPTVRGRVVNAESKPVAGARVFLATHSQMLGIEEQDEDNWSSNQKVVTDAQGTFALPAQFERYALVALHDEGYAEANFDPDQPPGELSLRAWAHVEGRLMEAGQPVPSAWVHFAPIRLRSGGSPHIQDGISVKTDRSGHFVLPRVPPVKSSVRAQLSVWRDFPIRSSQSVPMDLQAGQRIAVDLGGEGASVTGRVIPSGVASIKIDIRKSLNYLVRRGPGIEPPSGLRSLGFDARRGWSNAWTGSAEGLEYLATLNYHFVTLDQDGRFRIGGVPAGDYDFAIALYQPPEGGCLVSPVGTKVVRVRVTEDAARKGTLDLGDMTVDVRPGPHPGEVVPDLAFAAFSGETVKLSEFRGRYVLLDFWATWCGPCVADLPAVRKLQDTYGASNRLAILGLNLDDDTEKARQFVRDRRLPWTQGSLGGLTDNPLLARYAVSSVPAYFLIGPDGELIQSGQSAEEVAEVLRRLLP